MFERIEFRTLWLLAGLELVVYRAGKWLFPSLCINYIYIYICIYISTPKTGLTLLNRPLGTGVNIRWLLLGDQISSAVSPFLLLPFTHLSLQSFYHQFLVLLSRDRDRSTVPRKLMLALPACPCGGEREKEANIDKLPLRGPGVTDYGIYEQWTKH